MFFKKKKKQNIALDEAFARLEVELEKIEDSENPRKLEEYILDSCERIISMTREIESQKSQYRLLNEYIEDIDKIRNMDSTRAKELKEVVKNIIKLNASRSAYQKSEPRLTDDQFFTMEEHENTILGDIHRMQGNEIYQTKVERDMKYLEAEKSRWEIERDELSDIADKCKIISISIFTLVIAVLIGGIIMQNVFDYDIMMYATIVLFVGVVLIFAIFIYSSSKRKEARAALRQLNQAISLLNIVRMKYANVTKALIYEQEVYQVETSAELHYIWEQYILAVKEQERFIQDNMDLEYYSVRFNRIMKALELKHEKIWMSKAKAVVNTEEIEKVANELILKKKKIHDIISNNINLVKEERDEIDKLMRDNDYYVPEIMEIIASVDRMCGLSSLRMSKGGTQ